MLSKLKHWASRLKRDVLALWFCCKDPRTPLSAKLIAGLGVGYGLSPIDLIPDFIPVIGYLDDLIIVPIGIYFALKLVPAAVLDESRAMAQRWFDERKPKPRNYVAAVLFVAIWLILG